MRYVRAICLSAAVALAYAVPASAQSFNTSWEGATHEMQKRGPTSDIHGPDWGGRIYVTPGRNAYRHYWPRHSYRYHRAPRPYYGMGYYR